MISLVLQKHTITVRQISIKHKLAEFAVYLCHREAYGTRWAEGGSSQKDSFCQYNLV